MSRADLIAAIGLILIVAGVASYSAALALIVLGLGILAAGILMAKQEQQ